MVKKRGIIWNYYNKKVDGTQVIAFCKFCDQSYIQNATRMERHMERCQKCPEEIRQQFIQAAHNKKYKTHFVDIKVNGGWPKQESSVDRNGTDTEFEEADDWNYQDQIYSGTVSGTVQQNTNLVIQTSDQNWSQEAIIENENTDVGLINRDWDINGSNSEPSETANPQERTSSIHQRKSHAPRRISQRPFLSMRTSGYSLLQSKIFQEQLLERRTLRKVAELELRRKTLELEKLQWEYERDKIQSEVRWAHETRMMQLREELERQNLEQNKSQDLHVIQ